jgi:hypothetical protein
VPSEEWWASVAAYEAGRRVIAACFGLYAPDALAPPVAVFLPQLQEVQTIDKTRNQFTGMRSYEKQKGTQPVKSYAPFWSGLFRLPVGQDPSGMVQRY